MAGRTFSPASRASSKPANRSPKRENGRRGSDRRGHEWRGATTVSGRSMDGALHWATDDALTMSIRGGQMVRAVFVCLAVAIVAVVEAVFLHWEMIPASLLVTAIVIPSILTFVLMERYLTQWRRTRHLTFMLGLLPFGGMLLYGLIAVAGGDPEGVGDWCKLLGFWYVTQALSAYVLLVLPYRTALPATHSDAITPAPPDEP